MKSKAAILFNSLIFGLPLMLGFQNCAKVQNVAMTDVSGAYKASSIDTGNLPQNTTVPVEQPGSNSSSGSSQPSGSSGSVGSSGSGAGSGSGSGGSSMPGSGPGVGGDDSQVNTQVIDPKKEDQDDVAEAIAICQNPSESANENNQASYSNDSASGIRGKKVLSKEDFGGNSIIKSITDAYGKIYVCNLDIDSYSHSGGKLILVNSHIKSLSSFHGTVHVVGNSTIAGNMGQIKVAKGIIAKSQLSNADGGSKQ